LVEARQYLSHNPCSIVQHMSLRWLSPLGHTRAESITAWMYHPKLLLRCVLG
jgi:hypothetical protein